MKKITKKQAIEIARKYWEGRDESFFAEAYTVISVKEGRSDYLPNYKIQLRPRKYFSENCWIIEFTSREHFRIIDGSGPSMIWIDQLTGKVVRSGGIGGFPARFCFWDTTTKKSECYDLSNAPYYFDEGTSS